MNCETSALSARQGPQIDADEQRMKFAPRFLLDGKPPRDLLRKVAEKLGCKAEPLSDRGGDRLFGPPMVWQDGLSPTGPLPLLLQLQYEKGNTYAVMPEGFPATESDETKVSYQGT